MTPDFNTQAERLNAKFDRGILTEAEYVNHASMLVYEAREERARGYLVPCLSCGAEEKHVVNGDCTTYETLHTEDCLYLFLVKRCEADAALSDPD